MAEPSEDDALKVLARVTARLEELLDRLPVEIAKDLRARIATLRTVVLEKRPARRGQVVARQRALRRQSGGAWPRDGADRARALVRIREGRRVALDPRHA